MVEQELLFVYRAHALEYPLIKKCSNSVSQPRRVFNLAFPDYRDLPPGLTQQPLAYFIPLNRSLEFFHPIRMSCSWCRRTMASVAMPEAAMDEDYLATLAEYDIWTPR